MAHDARPLADDFQVKWTPTLLILDHQGREHHRTVGFLASEELVPSLMLGIGKAYFERDEFEAAKEWFKRVLEAYPESSFSAEAIFYGVWRRISSPMMLHP